MRDGMEAQRFSDKGLDLPGCEAHIAKHARQRQARSRQVEAGRARPGQEAGRVRARIWRPQRGRADALWRLGKERPLLGFLE